MLDNSGCEYLSEYFNQSIPLDSNNHQDLKSVSITKIETLLQNLKKAKEINILMQNSAFNRMNESKQKMSKIQSLLEKINSIKKSKPKKHLKYPNYIPLDSFYYYTPKKTHLYYHLLERVFESNKKDSEKDDNNTSEQKLKMNRYNFNKQHDNSLNNIIFLNEKDNIINWYKVSAEMNNSFNNNNNRNNLNNINSNNYLIEEQKNEKESENNEIISIKDSDEE